jgi:hypothetical protein
MYCHTHSTGLNSGEYGRQRHERDVCRQAQRLCAVPPGLVEEKGDVLVLADTYVANSASVQRLTDAFAYFRSAFCAPQ